MGIVYFPPCHFPYANDFNRCDTICQAIQQLPNIAFFPNILHSLKLMSDFLNSKPESWKDGARYLATDFVAPGKARLKIYLGYPGESLDEIWDYYTLGGRIPAIKEDKALFHDMITLTGTGADNGRKNPNLGFTDYRRKRTCIYFSLSPDNPAPAPKLGITRGLDNGQILTRASRTGSGMFRKPLNPDLSVMDFTLGVADKRI